MKYDEMTDEEQKYLREIKAKTFKYQLDQLMDKIKKSSTMTTKKSLSIMSKFRDKELLLKEKIRLFA